MLIQKLNSILIASMKIEMKDLGLALNTGGNPQVRTPGICPCGRYRMKSIPVRDWSEDGGYRHVMAELGAVTAAELARWAQGEVCDRNSCVCNTLQSPRMPEL
jgi:hypothetical protein